MKLEKDEPTTNADSARKPESHESVVAARETYEAMLRDFLRQRPHSSKILIRKGHGPNARLVVVSDRSGAAQLPVGLKEAQAALINNYNHVAAGGGRVSHHDMATDPSEAHLHHAEPHHDEPHHLHDDNTPGHAYCRKVEEALLIEHEEQHTRHKDALAKISSSKRHRHEAHHELGHENHHHSHHR